MGQDQESANDPGLYLDRGQDGAGHVLIVSGNPSGNGMLDSLSSMMPDADDGDDAGDDGADMQGMGGARVKAYWNRWKC
jgi:hypothetical protein